jgi:CsoR family transcriptional regulator, copper-sensing transcriptional repressor
MRFPDESNTDVIQRLRRLEGQIRGIQRMVDEGAECRDIVTQLAAAKAALDRVGFRLMAAGMRQCARDGAELDAEELEKLFLKLS